MSMNYYPQNIQYSAQTSDSVSPEFLPVQAQQFWGFGFGRPFGSGWFGRPFFGRPFWGYGWGAGPYWGGGFGYPFWW